MLIKQILFEMEIFLQMQDLAIPIYKNSTILFNPRSVMTRRSIFLNQMCGTSVLNSSSNVKMNFEILTHAVHSSLFAKQDGNNHDRNK